MKRLAKILVVVALLSVAGCAKKKGWMDGLIESMAGPGAESVSEEGPKLDEKTDD